MRNVGTEAHERFPKGLMTGVRANRPSLQGSVFWMAPEIVKQTSYTSKADIWSVGCLVVEMLTGTHPWAELTQMQAIFRVSFLAFHTARIGCIKLYDKALLRHTSPIHTCLVIIHHPS